MKNIIKRLLVLLFISLTACTNKWQEVGCANRKISYLVDKDYISEIKIEINLTEKEFITYFESTSTLDSLKSSSYKREEGRELTYNKNGDVFQLLYAFYPSIQIDKNATGSGQLIDKLFDKKGIPKENIVILEQFLCE